MQFKSTRDIIKTPNLDEVFDINWMDSNKIVLPPTKYWDYKRELKIEDVQVWEVICGGFNNFGVYAAWEPYAEFYLVHRIYPEFIETFYGPKAQEKLKEFMKKNGIPIYETEIWVEPEDMYLYK